MPSTPSSPNALVRPLAQSLLAAGAALSLSACGLLPGLMGGNVFQLDVGTCFDDDLGAGDEVSDVPIVDCSEPHDFEVYAAVEMEEGDGWDQDAVYELGDRFCLEEFADFVGADYAESELDFTYLSPTELSWATGDREITCYVFEYGEKTSGTLEGAGR